MKYFLRIPVILLSAAVILGGCAKNIKTIPVPDAVMNLNPALACAKDGQGSIWDLRAQLYETPDNAYLVFYLDTGFTLVQEPDVNLRAGFAVFEFENEHTYTYRLGKLPKSKRIGIVSFPTPVRERVGRETVNKIVRLALERRPGTDCLRVTELD